MGWPTVCNFCGPHTSDVLGGQSAPLCFLGPQKCGPPLHHPPTPPPMPLPRSRFGTRPALLARPCPDYRALIHARRGRPRAKPRPAGGLSMDARGPKRPHRGAVPQHRPYNRMPWGPTTCPTFRWFSVSRWGAAPNSMGAVPQHPNPYGGEWKGKGAAPLPQTRAGPGAGLRFWENPLTLHPVSAPSSTFGADAPAEMAR